MRRVVGEHLDNHPAAWKLHSLAAGRPVVVSLVASVSGSSKCARIMIKCSATKAVNSFSSKQQFQPDDVKGEAESWSRVHATTPNDHRVRTWRPG